VILTAMALLIWLMIDLMLMNSIYIKYFQRSTYAAMQHSTMKRING
jgi:uncharacterized membrane protein